MDSLKINKVQIRNLQIEDYDQLAQSFTRVYTDGSDVFWTHKQIEKLIKIFPEDHDPFPVPWGHHALYSRTLGETGSADGENPHAASSNSISEANQPFYYTASDLFRQIPFLMNIPKKIISLHCPMRPRWPRSEEPSVFRCGNLCGFVSVRIDCIFRGSGTHQVFAAKTSENESLRYRKRFFQNIRACNA